MPGQFNGQKNRFVGKPVSFVWDRLSNRMRCYTSGEAKICRYVRKQRHLERSETSLFFRHASAPRRCHVIPPCSPIKSRKLHFLPRQQIAAPSSPLSQAQHPDLDKRLRRGRRRRRRRRKQGCSLKNPAAFRKYLKGGSFWRVCEERRVTMKAGAAETGRALISAQKNFGLTIWLCGVRLAAAGFGIWRKNVLTFFSAEMARHCCQTTNTTSNY